MSLPHSIKLGYAVFSDHIHTPELLRARTNRLFEWVREGKLEVGPATGFALSEAAKAHEAMESRTTTGKLLLFP
jgi:NADPH2:quinone reductase